jgi:hypothetical protein
VVFFWDNFNTAQNIAIIIITFLIGAAILGAVWAIWGIKMGRLDSEQNDKEHT